MKAFHLQDRIKQCSRPHVSGYFENGVFSPIRFSLPSTRNRPSRAPKTQDFENGLQSGGF